jgi:hypothetical protein
MKSSSSYSGIELGKSANADSLAAIVNANNPILPYFFIVPYPLVP